MNNALFFQALKCLGTWARKRVRDFRKWTWRGHDAEVQAIALLSDGRALSGSRDQTMKVWKIETGECIKTIDTRGTRGRLGYDGDAVGISCLAVLSDGRVAAAGDSFMDVRRSTLATASRFSRTVGSLNLARTAPRPFGARPA